MVAVADFGGVLKNFALEEKLKCIWSWHTPLFHLPSTIKILLIAFLSSNSRLEMNILRLHLVSFFYGWILNQYSVVHSSSIFESPPIKCFSLPDWEDMQIFEDFFFFWVFLRSLFRNFINFCQVSLGVGCVHIGDVWNGNCMGFLVTLSLNYYMHTVILVSLSLLRFESWDML